MFNFWDFINYFIFTEKLLQRGEAIEGIESKAEELRVKTADFDRQARRLKCKMCQENIKMCVCLAVVITVSIKLYTNIQIFVLLINLI